MSLSRRVLFTSPHCYLDPYSGAALATRDLLSALAAQGWTCGAFCGTLLDATEPVPFDWLLARHGFTPDIQRARLLATQFSLYHFYHQQVRVTALHPDAAWHTPASERATTDAYLDVLEGVLDRFVPEVVLTYGGDALTLAATQRVRARGIPIVFSLHNDAYHHVGPFRDADSVLVPSIAAQKWYRDRLNLECVALPGLFDTSSVYCESVTPTYLTFVNPSYNKGVVWLARLIAVLAQRRPDIPVLVVQGRGQFELLRQCGVDLGGVSTVHYMRHTVDPRHFYRLHR